MDDFEKFKRDVESLRKRRDQAAGAEKEVANRVRKEFPIKTLDEGAALLEKMQNDTRKFAVRFTKKFKKVKSKYRKELEGL